MSEANGRDFAGQHVFEQLADVSVNVCICGKWPTHHVHASESPLTCSCDSCRGCRAQ